MLTAAAASAGLEFDTAASALRAAVVAALTDAAAHEALAVAVLETGTDTDSAAATLRRSIELAPASGGSKYPYLTQLVEEDPAEALRLMRVGIRNMRAGLGLGPGDGAAAAAGGGGGLGVGGGPGEEAAPPASPPPLGPTHPDRPDAFRQLCSVYCAVAEVHLAVAEAEGEPGGGGAPARAMS